MPAAVRVVSLLSHSANIAALSFRMPFMRRSCMEIVSFTQAEALLINEVLAEFGFQDDVRIKAYLENPNEN
jgi:hypothetical protein